MMVRDSLFASLHPLPSMSTPEPVKKIFRAGESREKCLLGQRAHKVAANPYEIMVVHKSPRVAGTTGGATQEVESPMPDKRTATRFTVYAVARDVRHFNSDSGISHGHRATLDEAKALARQLDADRKCHPTRITERMESYPFEVVQTVWRCDA